MPRPENPTPTDPQQISLADLQALKPYVKLSGLADLSGINRETMKSWMYYNRETSEASREDLRRGVLRLASMLLEAAGAGQQ